MIVDRPAVRDIFEISDNRLILNFHEGQWRTWDSAARFVVMLAGTQGGKTSFGPHWLFREIQRCGAGDYLCVAPTYPLMNKKMLPEFRRVFEKTFRLGRYVGGSDKTFRFDAIGERKVFGSEQNTQTRVLFGHAQDADSLESATARAAWLDEAGQKKFKSDSFDAILRRLFLHQGRCLITTTPFYWGWFKRRLVDAADDDDEIDVVNFASTANPLIGADVVEKERQRVADWKYKLFYLAQFTKPAGVIYEDFKHDRHVVDPFVIPPEWTIFVGVDFGAVNTAAVFIARDHETRDLYVCKTYTGGNKSIEDHAKIMLDAPRKFVKRVADDEQEDDARFRVVAYGGSKSEKQWRREFGKYGLKVRTPLVPEVEIGIDRVIAALKTDQLKVFANCVDLIDEFESYSRVLGEDDEPTEEIEDKSTYHLLDALRYVVPACSRTGLVLW